MHFDCFRVFIYLLPQANLKGIIPQFCENSTTQLGFEVNTEKSPAAPYHLHGVAVVHDAVEVMREMKPVAVAAAPPLKCVQLMGRNWIRESKLVDARF